MIRIAIPEPTSADADYNSRSLPAYLNALKAAGAEPVVISLAAPQQQVAAALSRVQGILLPGSRFDVDPERYGEPRQPECGPADALRTAVDELFLQDAFSLRKPVLGICHGAQTMNVWRNGTLVQDVKTAVNHRPGRDVTAAHPVEIAAGSRLSRLLPEGEEAAPWVNSSHHQAIREPGDNLRAVAVSPGDGVIEAVEGETASHFVLGVQWHPERTYGESAFSRAIFAAFVKAAEGWHAPEVAETRR